MQKRNKRLEDHIQAECVAYFNRNYPRFRKNLVRIKNEYSTNFDITLGVIPGAADLILTFQNMRFIWIETKKPGGYQSPDQKAFQAEHEKLGNRYYIIKSLDDFKEILEYYKKEFE